MNQELHDELITLIEEDRDLRTALLEAGTLYEGYDERMEALHLEHGRRLQAIIDEHGWPGQSLVGRDGARAAFRIAQHTISSPELQRSFLKELQEAVAEGEATPLQEACLTDRILYNEGQPQRYGMLFGWNEHGELYAHIEDPEAVAERRKQLGLKPLDEAIRAHRQEILEEGGGPPTDIQMHQRREEAWARRVGWRI